MSTTKIVDYGSAQTLHCQICVDGDWADFDPTASTATIKSAIEALASMSGHTVTVTEITSDQKWQFAFDFTVTTFAATLDNLCLRWKFDEGTGTAIADSSGQENDGTATSSSWTSSTENGGGSDADLTFSNPYAYDGVSGGSASKSSPTNLPTADQGATIVIRFKAELDTLASFSIFGSQYGGGNQWYAGYYSSYSGILFGSGPIGASYNAYFAWTPDENWHILAIVCPASGSMADTLMYLDAASQTVSNDGDYPYAWGQGAINIGDYVLSSYPFYGYVDHAMIFRGEKDATFIGNIKSYNPTVSITITDGGGAVVKRRNSHRLNLLGVG